MGVPEVPVSLRSWMSAVGEIVRAVNAAEPLEKVLTRVAVQACELIGFEFCAVMLADSRREFLSVVGCSGLTPGYLARISDDRSLEIYPPDGDLGTPAAQAYREDRTIVVPESRANEELRRGRAVLEWAEQQRLSGDLLGWPTWPAPPPSPARPR